MADIFSVHANQHPPTTDLGLVNSEFNEFNESHNFSQREQIINHCTSAWPNSHQLPWLPEARKVVKVDLDLHSCGLIYILLGTYSEKKPRHGHIHIA